MLAMYPLSLLSGAFLLHFTAVLAAEKSSTADHFIEPLPSVQHENWPDNIVYHVGDRVDIQWQGSDLTNFGALLYQDTYGNNSNSVSASLMGPLNDATTFSWQVTLNYGSTIFDLTPTDDTPGNVFSIFMYNNGSTSPSFSTRSFNISTSKSTSSASASSSTSASTSTATATSSLPPHFSTSSTSLPSSTAAAAAAPATPPSAGLTAGQQAGIGVGVGLVGLLAITALVLYFLRFRRRSGPAPLAQAPRGNSPGVGFVVDSIYTGKSGSAVVQENMAEVAGLGGDAEQYRRFELQESGR